ncbi:MAG: CvpA family protein [Alphaproteobacteria bacterium]|jgi:membrane protein required for colicin V production
MTDLHITWADFAVAVILALSVWIAIYRGFVRETLSIFAWAAAAFATLYFGRYAVPLLAPHMPRMLAQILGYAGVFLLVVIPLALISSGLSRRVQASPVGAIDRVAGALFGILRGLVIIAVLYILYSLVIPVSVQARWMKDARTLPLVQKSATTLLSLLPDNDARYVEQRTRGAEPKTSEMPNDGSSEAKTSAAHHRVLHKGYGAQERRRLNRLIEATGHGQ